MAPGASGGYTALADVWSLAGGQVIEQAGVGPKSAGGSLAAVTTRLAHELAGCWGSWGQDNIGEAFENGQGSQAGFGRAADNLLTAMAAMVNTVAAAGWQMQVTGANYAAAEHANTIGAGKQAPASVPRPPTYTLPAVARSLTPTDPPPGEFAYIIGLLESMVGSCQYPDGNFAVLGQVAAALSAASRQVKSLTEALQSSGQCFGLVTAAGNAGDAASAYAGTAKNVISGLEWIHQQAAALASSASSCLAQKHAARITFWASLAFLAVMLAASVAMSWFTFGGSLGVFLGCAEAEAGSLADFLAQVLRTVVESMVFSAGDDAISQLAKMHERLQGGFDWAQLGEQAGIGAASGLLMLGLSAGMKSALGASLTHTLGQDAADKALGVLEDKSMKGVGARLVFNGLAGTAANVTVQAATDDRHVDLASAASSGFGMAALGESHELPITGPRVRAARAATLADFSTPPDSDDDDPPPPPPPPGSAASPRAPVGDTPDLASLNTASTHPAPADDAGSHTTADAGHDAYQTATGTRPADTTPAAADDLTTPAATDTPAAAPPDPPAAPPDPPDTPASPPTAGQNPGRPAPEGGTDTGAAPQSRAEAAPEGFADTGHAPDGGTGTPSPGGSGGASPQLADLDTGGRTGPPVTPAPDDARPDTPPARHPDADGPAIAGEPARHDSAGPLVTGTPPGGQHQTAGGEDEAVTPDSTARPELLASGIPGASSDRPGPPDTAPPDYTAPDYTAPDYTAPDYTAPDYSAEDAAHAQHSSPPDDRPASAGRNPKPGSTGDDSDHHAVAGNGTDGRPGRNGQADSSTQQDSQADAAPGRPGTEDTGAAGTRADDSTARDGHPGDTSDTRDTGRAGTGSRHPNDDNSRADRPGTDRGEARNTARGGEAAIVAPERVAVTETVRVTVRNPEIRAEDVKKGYVWGIARDKQGHELPVDNGLAMYPSPYDVLQGGVGDCGYLSSFAEVLRHLDATEGAAPKYLITDNGDGTSTARIYEARLVEHGTGKLRFTVSEPTGRLFEITMKNEVVLTPDGEPAYADFAEDGAILVPLAEKAMAAADQLSTVFQRGKYEKPAVGYERISGSGQEKWAQAMTMWTGKPARTFSPAETEDPVAFMRTVQQIRQADLPVVTGTLRAEEYQGAERITIGHYSGGEPREVIAPYKILAAHAHGVNAVVDRVYGDVEGGRLLLHNPHGGELRGNNVLIKPGELPELLRAPNGEPKNYIAVTPEPIRIDKNLWQVVAKYNWATLDHGTDPMRAEHQALADALHQAGVPDLPPRQEGPSAAARALADAAPPAAGPGDRPAPDAGRLARSMADVLGEPAPDAARLLARLHDATADPAASQRVRAAYADLTGHDLADDIRRAPLGLDPQPYLARLEQDGTAPPAVPALDTDTGSAGYAAALHEAISAHDGVTAGALLDQAGRSPEKLWSLDDHYREAYGSDVSQHIDAAFGESPEGGYLRYLAGDQHLATTAVSVPEVQDLFRRLEPSVLTTTNTYGNVSRSVPWEGAADRAHQMALKLTEWGYAPRKIFALGKDLLYPQREMPDWVPDYKWGEPLSKTMHENAAVVLTAFDSDGNAFNVVLDPLAGDRPLTVEEWMNRMGVSPGSFLQFDTSGLDLPARAAADEVITDYVLGTARDKLYGKAMAYTADPEARYPFAAAEYFGRDQRVPVYSLKNDYPVEGDEYKNPSEREIDVARFKQDYPFRERSLRGPVEPAEPPVIAGHADTTAPATAGRASADPAGHAVPETQSVPPPDDGPLALPGDDIAAPVGSHGAAPGDRADAAPRGAVPAEDPGAEHATPSAAAPGHPDDGLAGDDSDGLDAVTKETAATAQQAREVIGRAGKILADYEQMRPRSVEEQLKDMKEEVGRWGAAADPLSQLRLRMAGVADPLKDGDSWELDAYGNWELNGEYVGLENYGYSPPPPDPTGIAPGYTTVYIYHDIDPDGTTFRPQAPVKARKLGELLFPRRDIAENLAAAQREGALAERSPFITVTTDLVDAANPPGAGRTSPEVDEFRVPDEMLISPAGSGRDAGLPQAEAGERYYLGPPLDTYKVQSRISPYWANPDRPYADNDHPDDADGPARPLRTYHAPEPDDDPDGRRPAGPSRPVDHDGSGDLSPAPPGGQLRPGRIRYAHDSAGASTPADAARDAPRQPETASTGQQPRPAMFDLGSEGKGVFRIAPDSPLLIGRDSRSPLSSGLSDQGVSREHATMGTAPDGTRWIRDEHSTNGTYVNGQRITSGAETPLPADFTLGLGKDTVIRVSFPPDPDPAPPGTPR